MPKNILQIAHRGNSQFYKDNSLESIESAINENFDIIEIDIQLCKSGEIIVYHDTYLQEYMIENLTIEEISLIDDKILKLEDVFNIKSIKNTKLYLDLKGNITLANSLVKFLQINNIKLENLYIASFNILHIEYLYKFFPNISYGIITANNFDATLYYSLIQKKYFKFFSICWTMLNKNTCDLLHAMDLKIFIYSCENKTIYNKILQYDIDGIVTNYKFP